MILAPFSFKVMSLPQRCGLGFSCGLQGSRNVREEVESAAGLNGIDRGAEGRVVVGAVGVGLVGVDVGGGIAQRYRRDLVALEVLGRGMAAVVNERSSP